MIGRLRLSLRGRMLNIWADMEAFPPPQLDTQALGMAQ